ncbi:MAG: hypothetical protein JSU01_11050 [Bacteroidetes bacterium]|nr:hypothetical protein [Bacteroidota bacterium]
MTTLIIKSDSDKKTDLLKKFAEELGLEAQTQEFRELRSKDMAAGIGRKATDEELISYLLKDKEQVPSERS